MQQVKPQLFEEDVTSAGPDFQMILSNQQSSKVDDVEEVDDDQQLTDDGINNWRSQPKC